MHKMAYSKMPARFNLWSILSTSQPLFCRRDEVLHRKVTTDDASAFSCMSCFKLKGRSKLLHTSNLLRNTVSRGFMNNLLSLLTTQCFLLYFLGLPVFS